MGRPMKPARGARPPKSVRPARRAESTGRGAAPNDSADTARRAHAGEEQTGLVLRRLGARAPAVTVAADAVSDELDWYYQRALEHGPDPAKLRTSQEARAERREASGARTIVAIDDMIVRAFRRLSHPDRDWRSLMHRALCEWLASRAASEDS